MGEAKHKQKGKKRRCIQTRRPTLTLKKCQKPKEEGKLAPPLTIMSYRASHTSNGSPATAEHVRPLRSYLGGGGGSIRLLGRGSEATPTMGTVRGSGTGQPDWESRHSTDSLIEVVGHEYPQQDERKYSLIIIDFTRINSERLSPSQVHRCHRGTTTL